MENIKLRRSARKDSLRIEKLVYDYYFSLVPKVFDIEEEEMICKKIMDYLSSSKEDIDRIVILDDNDDGISNFFEEEFILVNRFFGLNNSVYQKALEILK